MSAPLKPWEQAGSNNHRPTPSDIGRTSFLPGESSGQGGASLLPTDNVVQGSNVTATSAVPPPVPPRNPSSALQPVGGYSSLGYNTTSYGGGYSPYSMGGTGLYGGGTGLYGGGTGLYGGMGYGGYGGYNRGYGMQDNYGQNSGFVRMAEESSRQAFQSIESIVQAFGSVAMMLESTFAAVYNSFRAVIGVADHFSRMRAHLAQILSAFAVIRTLKWLYRRLLVLLRLRSGGAEEEAWSTVAEAASSMFTDSNPQKPRANWPLMMFFAVIVGGPYLIWKFLSSISSQNSKDWKTGEADHFVAVAEYDFQGQADDELSFKHGQQIIVAPKELQPMLRGWVLAAIDNREGIVPTNYIKMLGKRRGQKKDQQGHSSEDSCERKPSQAQGPPVTLENQWK